MSADKVGVIDIGVVNIFSRLPLCLQFFDHITFLDQVVCDFDAGNLIKRLGQNFRFIFVSRNCFGDHLDLHVLEGLGGIHEPLHFLHLLVLGQGRRLEFLIDPLFSGGHVCACRTGEERHQHCDQATHKRSPGHLPEHPVFHLISSFRPSLGNFSPDSILPARRLESQCKMKPTLSLFIPKS